MTNVPKSPLKTLFSDTLLSDTQTEQTEANKQDTGQTIQVTTPVRKSGRVSKLPGHFDDFEMNV